jgi:xanthine/CO dehydrogenase XdhC/CoxF family maturation factor
VARTVNAAEAARLIADAQRAGRELVTVTIVSGADAGARYCSEQLGDLSGDVATEADMLAAQLAGEVWQTRAPVFRAGLFAELHAVAEPLLIFGAGHIAVPLANIALTLGFDVTVLDDREEFAEPTRFAEGVTVCRLDYAAPLAGLRITSNTFVVLVTRAHKYDFDCLRAVVEHPVLPRYIGMIGSKRRVRAAFKALLDGGVPRELLARVNAPVGLEIGAETPAEIAVSIAAELIQVRRNAAARTMGDDARVLDRMFPEHAAQ